MSVPMLRGHHIAAHIAEPGLSKKGRVIGGPQSNSGLRISRSGSLLIRNPRGFYISLTDKRIPAI